MNNDIIESEECSTKESSSSGDDLKSDINYNSTDNPIDDNSKLPITSEQEDTENALPVVAQDKNPQNNMSTLPYKGECALKINSSKLNAINAEESFRPRSSKIENISLSKSKTTLNSSTKISSKVSKDTATAKIGSSSYNSKTSLSSKLHSHFSNKNISADYQSSNENIVINDDRSNLFLYIDFHGHASKKGVFMYGNHLPNIYEAVECMLLPRLMSMNSQHFHFDACNFSERNMYLK